MNWYLDVLKKYAVFSGRARRQEYWMFVLFNVLAVIVFSIIDAVIGMNLFVIIYWLGVLIPSLAVAVRRLHDTDKSGWFLLIGLIPLVGGIILLVFMATEGKPNENQYGPNPKLTPTV
ncbi:DUF805 domain-containing protein [Streptomyces sp. NPDC091292]|uniref:DUF805 domain-containing protein n=1 Tax=Streptomyces sp. NPDC091292 TaxID=3365991 RepID=UPI003815637F